MLEGGMQLKGQLSAAAACIFDKAETLLTSLDCCTCVTNIQS